MKLSVFERLLLLNQYRILEKLYPEEAKYIAVTREAIEHGYALHYEDAVQFLHEEMPDEDCVEVQSILGMFRCLQRGYDAMPDKTLIENWRIQFRGFDGNEEGQLMLYTQYYINRLERFSEFAQGGNRSFNSHMPCLDRYRRMIAAWHQSKDENNLTPDDVVRIANA